VACNKQLQCKGKAYPRTCDECGLGPCRHSGIEEATHHRKCYGKESFVFEWGTVTHPGVWACGGGRQDLPPVLVGVTWQVPQKDPEYAWWCYLGPRPEFANEFDADDKDKRYFQQCQSVPTNITRNM
jgi:hypothetical protein